MYALEISKPNTTTSRELLDESSFNSYLETIQQTIAKGAVITYWKQEQMIGDQLKVTAHFFKQRDKTIALVEYEK